MITFSFEAGARTIARARGPVIVVLILERENLDRMREGDPFDIQFRKYNEHWKTTVPLSDVDLVIAYEEDTSAVIAFHERQDIAGLLKYLERGRCHSAGDGEPPKEL